MNIEDLIKDAVDDGVRSVPPGFADGAIRRARRQVRTTRIVIASGVAAFAMAAAAVAVVDPGDLRTDAPPAETPDPEPAVLVDDVTDFDAVRTGAAPSVSWYTDDALHFEGTSTPFDVPFAELSLDRVDGGFVALVVPPGGEQPDDVLYLVPDGGTPEQLDNGELSEVVVSPDGGQFAYLAAVPGDGGIEVAGEMRTADARTGERLHEQASFSRTARPLHYASADEIVVDTLIGGVLLYETWRPGEEPTSWDQVVPVDGRRAELSPAHDRAAVPDGEAHLIYAVLDNAGRARWNLEPSQGHPRFSPDGRFLASVGILVTDETTSIMVRDARLGIDVDRFGVARPGPPVWESATTVLFTARTGDGDREAIVRCTVETGCELATEPLDTSETTESAIIIGQ